MGSVSNTSHSAVNQTSHLIRSALDKARELRALNAGSHMCEQTALMCAMSAELRTAAEMIDASMPRTALTDMNEGANLEEQTEFTFCL